MNAMTPDIAAPRGNGDDADYSRFLDRVNARFHASCNGEKMPLFTTDADLWGSYLDSFGDPAEKQHHNCNACRHFIQRFGGLATIGADGLIHPAVWNEGDAIDSNRSAVAAMARAVRRASITGVFLSSERVLGTPRTGPWAHLGIHMMPGRVYSSLVLTPHQAMAQKKEDFRTVMRALNEFTVAHLTTAVTLLKTEALYRSEKVLGAAEWLLNLKHAFLAAPSSIMANIVWKAVATAPAGFCHPRSSMIGTLLEDIAAGKTYDDVSRAFAAKMNPLLYQRPQAAPTAGAIAEAENLVEKLGIARSLPRRFCRLDEVQALWRPTPKKEETTGGVFGHLKPKGETSAPAMTIPAQTMTWAKFSREVLPTAERIEFKAPGRGNYVSLTTAVDADAPPILQWDREDSRNPVSWYCWHNGSTASQFGLRGDHFHEVAAITRSPSHWNGEPSHQTDGVVFLIADAKESRKPSGGLFPETLKSELHGVRSVIEAYSQKATLEGFGEPHAAGVALTSKGSWDATVRVWSGGRSLDYQLDRWD